MQQPRDLPVGHAVFYAREQTVGIIYETYTFVDGPGARPGVSVILADGRDLSGFSAQEANQFLQPLGDSSLDYSFTNVGQLHTDFRSGLFGQALHEAQVMLISQTLAGNITLSK